MLFIGKPIGRSIMISMDQSCVCCFLFVKVGWGLAALKLLRLNRWVDGFRNLDGEAQRLCVLLYEVLLDQGIVTVPGFESRTFIENWWCVLQGCWNYYFLTNPANPFRYDTSMTFPGQLYKSPTSHISGDLGRDPSLQSLLEHRESTFWRIRLFLIRR